jgi:hypothetical protein
VVRIGPWRRDFQRQAGKVEVKVEVEVKVPVQVEVTVEVGVEIQEKTRVDVYRLQARIRLDERGDILRWIQGTLRRGPARRVCRD